MERYPHIFSPGTIGRLTAKNRVKYAATETNFNTSDGFVTAREVAYMEAQAKGGAGIVTTQGAYPDAKGEGKGFRGMMAIYDDRFIPGLARIAEVIRANDALSCLQILHCGREGGVELGYSLMPSVVPQKLSYFKPPREITAAEIRQSVKDHVEAARRAVGAGFDMIEISGIVGYLISTFISRYTNKRSDEYNGTIRDRCRLMIEVLQGMKAQVGDMPVGIRLCGLELLDDRGGNSLEESMETFKIAEEAGADYVSVTIGWHESSQSVITRDVPMGHWLWVSKEVKKYVNVPVMMAFRQFLPEIPEKALGEGTIDFWEACRPMIADPELPRKAREGREEEIVPCIACNLCFSRLYYHQPIMCSVRPTVGYEGDPKWGYYGFSPSPEKKKVTVVGAGPSGLQFAAVAAEKGHDVTVIEKDREAGGSIHLAAMVDEGAVELWRPVRKLEHECRLRGVRFRFGTEFTDELLESEKPDVIVVAAGARYKRYPESSSVAFFTPYDVMEGKAITEKDVLIVGGDGVGLGVAVYLLRTGEYNITVAEESTKLGRDVNPFYLWQYVRLMKERNVKFIMGGRFVRGDEKGVVLAGAKGDMVLNVRSVVAATREPFNPLGGSSREEGLRVYTIGDAKRPRRLNNAIHDGYRLAMEAL